MAKVRRTNRICGSAILTALCASLLTFHPATGGVIEESIEPHVEADQAFAVLKKRRNAFYEWLIGPSLAVAGGKVFCAFQNHRGQPAIMSYDIAEKAWEGPVLASDFGLGRDEHGNPALYVGRDGCLHLFFGSHGGELKHTRSTKPYDISSWEAMASPTAHCTYPQVMRLADGTAYLFYRAGKHGAPWKVRSSSDDFVSWSSEEEILSGTKEGFAYAHWFPGADGMSIHGFWILKDDNPVERLHKDFQGPAYRYNTYYARRNSDETWSNGAGDTFQLPLKWQDEPSAFLIYDSGEDFVWPRQHAVDSLNRPYLKVLTGACDWGKCWGWGSEGQMSEVFLTLRNGGWVKSLRVPENWPEDVASVMGTHGELAYGLLPDGGYGLKTDDQWYMFFSRNLKPTPIFLYNSRSGYAVRGGGPAQVFNLLLQGLGQ